MFSGEYHFNIDEKGRLFIPVEFRKEFGSTVVVSCGIEKCLTIYTLSAWEKYINKIDTLVSTKKANREYKRMILSRTYQKEIDTKGRIKIENIQVAHANLVKECSIIGTGTYLEVWNKADWEKYFTEHLANMDELSEGIEFDD